MAELNPASPFAKLAAHELYGAPERDAERAQQNWVEALVEAPFEQIELDLRGELRFREQRVGKLVAGAQLLRPGLKLLLPDWVPPGSRGRIERRLTAHTRDLVAHLLEPLLLPVDASAPLRGLLYQLEQGLGTIRRQQAEAQLAALSEPERQLLHAHNIVLGRRTVFAQALLASTRRVIRMALYRALASDPRKLDPLNPDELIWTQLPVAIERESLLLLGFVPLATLALRCDVLETLLAQAQEDRVGEIELLLGSPRQLAERISKELSKKKRKRRRA
jgi:ATP-dependent RNA helicase SUPV3L1/SUV3